MSTELATVRTRWAAIGAAVAVTIGAAGIGGYNLVSADVSSGDRPIFVPIAPCRLADTRPAPNTVGPRPTPIGADETISITAHGDNGECTGTSQIPDDAVALAMNVTALGATEQTFLTFWGSGDNPGTANLNPAPGQPPTPNAVNTPVSPAGTFNLYNERGNVNVVIDVNGYYAHHDHDDRYEAIPDTIRLAPADFAPWSEDVKFARTDALRNQHGAACFYAPVHLPQGATIESVTGIVSVQNANDSVEVRLGRILFDDGISTIDAQPGWIADTTEQITAAGELTHVTTSTIADTVPGNGDDAVVDNDTFIYTAAICTNLDHRIWGYEIDLA